MTDRLLTVLGRSRALGYLGPGPVEDHLHHALAFADAIASPPARALDLGAGGGLPGLVLAAQRWPSTRWTFLDAQRKRTEFLLGAVEELALSDRVAILTDRAEVTGRDPAHRGCYDVVVSRSFGAPAVTAECAAPLLQPGGLLVVSEPPAAPDDRWPAEGLVRAGLRVDGPRVVDGVHLMVLVRTTDPIDQLPRRTGIPAKRPLFG